MTARRYLLSFHTQGVYLDRGPAEPEQLGLGHAISELELLGHTRTDLDQSTFHYKGLHKVRVEAQIRHEACSIRETARGVVEPLQSQPLGPPRMGPTATRRTWIGLRNILFVPY